MRKVLLAIVAFIGSNAFADYLPPQVLFHGGNRAPLMEDVKSGEIPLNIWNEFIMGDKTRFDLPPHRRGLYGSENIAVTSYYSFSSIKKAGDRNWTMMFELSPQCLQNERVESGNYIVDDDGRFAKWLRATKYPGDPSFKACVADQRWKVEASFDIHKLNREQLEQATRCSEVLNSYYDDLHIGIVVDDAAESSWYIRDRSCIESVSGTANELFDAIFKDQVSLFDSGDGNSFTPGGSFLLFVQVMAEANHYLRPDAVPQIAAFVKSGAEVLKDGRALGKDEIFLPDSGDYLTYEFAASSLQCLKKNIGAEFQKALLNFSEKMFSIYACKDEKNVGGCWNKTQTKQTELAVSFLGRARKLCR